MAKKEVLSDKQVYWQQFTGRLKEALEKKKMSKIEFAKQMNVTPTSVSHWLNDGRTPNAYYLNKMCDVLKVSADYLLGRKKGEK